MTVGEGVLRVSKTLLVVSEGVLAGRKTVLNVREGVGVKKLFAFRR